jgi:cis-3-alkyl-4-acyloxetan-2-one decarboxylase
MLDTIIHRWLRVPDTLNIRQIIRRPNAKQTVLLIHGLGDTGDLWKELYDELSDTVNIVSIDLLGFGNSPRPKWGIYNARTQARCLLATYLRLGLHGSVQIVGHSLGCLVAIDFARRYPLLMRQLVLCAPPIYRPQDKNTKQVDDRLRELYAVAAKKPALLVNMYGIGQKLRLLNPSIQVTKDNVEIFVKSLHSSIINQRTIDDIAKVKVPITIINGVFDPFVVQGNLAGLCEKHANIQLINIPAGHIISRPYRTEIIKALNA